MASFCTVSGQVVDPSGNPYINATLVVVFIPAPTATLAPTIGFIRTFPTVFAQATCDSTGRFVRPGLANNALITDGHGTGQQPSQWCFRFCTGPGYVPQIGFSWCGIISGDMDISSQLAAVAPPLIPPCGGGGGGPIVPPTVPVISALSPNMGPVGTVVTITGSNFGTTQGSGLVTFNGVQVPVTSWSGTRIVVTVSPGASTGNVLVTTSTGASNGMPFTVTSAPGVPVLTGINPASGAVSTTVNVTLTGTGLLGTTAVNSTDGITVSNVAVVDDTTVTATFTLPATATTTSITLVTPGGTSNALTFTVAAIAPPPAPVLTSVNPVSGPAGTSMNVTLSGHNLTGTTAVNATNLVTVSNVVVVSDTTITAILTLPTPAGGLTSSITVTTPAGTSNAVAFSVTTTTIGPPTGGTTFMLESITGGIVIPDGTYASQKGISLFCATAWSPSVTVAVGNQAYVTGTGSYDGYFVIAGISTGPDNFGMTLVASSNMNTSIIVEQGSLILGGTPPSGGGGGVAITTITPSSAAANSAAVMTLGGSGFTGATGVSYSGTGVTISNLSVASDTSLSVTFGISAVSTSGNVTVTSPAGTSNPAAFSVTAAVPPAGPLIHSVTPASGAPSSNVNITLSGSGFLGNPAIAPTTVGYSGTGVTISAVTVVNDTSITATLAIAAGATSGHLTVTTPSGTSNGASFAVTGAAAPTTPAGYPSFIYGGITIVGGTHAGQKGIYASMQTPVPATAVAGASVTISGTGSYDGTFVIASASGTDLVLVAGTNSATVIISKQGIIQFP